ncbi:hypothetical protein [Thiocystis violascens]|uniref:Uncharacterized protein n=1 Tax=Thiocystis violascens (strain ATCC 17096 / DSM 198 / 6111) TaxID=765911 RepID=I3YES8_THIV6|nr:hypothetical protein [Thiocystis violascens]AFL75496.1 hypothetical protein Thivi_3642 [Thiocystis violascens DSM 198]
MTAPNPAPRPDLGDISQFSDFARECERHKLATKSSLLWWMRYRHQNGLIASGAVIEKRPNPTSKRPMLFIVRPRFIDWLSNGNPEAA